MKKRMAVLLTVIGMVVFGFIATEASTVENGLSRLQFAPFNPSHLSVF